MSVSGPPIGPTLVVPRGGTRYFDFQLKKDGAALDLTLALTYVIYCDISCKRDEDPLLSKNSSDSAKLEVLDEATGKIRIHFSASDTYGTGSPLSVGKYLYVIWANIDGKPYSALAPSPLTIDGSIGTGVA